MFCKHCGKKLAEDARFCDNCGKPTSEQNQSATVQWETCAIEWWSKWLPLGLDPRFQFQAMATGPKGYYKVAESKIVTKYLGIQTDEQLQKGGGKEVTAAFDELIKRLIADGWEITGRGVYWWDQRFRRPVR